MAAEIKALFEGKWTVYQSENFEPFLDKMDVGFLKKKMALTLTPSMTVTVEGETITVAFTMGPMSRRASCKLGEQYEPEGEFPTTAIASFSDGKWTTEMTPKDSKKGKPHTIIRDIVDGNLVQTMIVEDVTCKRFLKKV